MAVKPIPEGYHSVTPYLMMKRAGEAIEFYKRAFGAVELMRLGGPDGKVGHAEIRIGDSPVMLADEHPDLGYVGPETLGGAGVSIMLYVEDADAVFQRAVDAGAEVLKPMENQFYGDRTGTVKDPFGHVWSIGMNVEKLTVEEISARMAAMMAGGDGQSCG